MLRMALFGGVVAVVPSALAVISEVAFTAVCVFGSFSSLDDSAGVTGSPFLDVGCAGDARSTRHGALFVFGFAGTVGPLRQSSFLRSVHIAAIFDR